jgi:hypothetical protein
MHLQSQSSNKGCAYVKASVFNRTAFGDGTSFFLRYDIHIHHQCTASRHHVSWGIASYAISPMPDTTISISSPTPVLAQRELEKQVLPPPIVKLGNATTAIKYDGRHHGFATVKGLPKKSGRAHRPQRIFITRDKRTGTKNKQGPYVLQSKRK